MTNENGIVKDAFFWFGKGDFKKAKALYEQAAKKHGSHLFASNIRLCERRLEQTATHSQRFIGSEQISLSNTADQEGVKALSRQLAETQKLLEHYYTKCQHMEYQLMDRK